MKVQMFFGTLDQYFRSFVFFAIIVSPEGFQTGPKSRVELIILIVVCCFRVDGFSPNEDSKHNKCHHVGFEKIMHLTASQMMLCSSQGGVCDNDAEKKFTTDYSWKLYRFDFLETLRGPQVFTVFMSLLEIFLADYFLNNVCLFSMDPHYIKMGWFSLASFWGPYTRGMSSDWSKGTLERGFAWDRLWNGL